MSPTELENEPIPLKRLPVLIPGVFDSVWKDARESKGDFIETVRRDVKIENPDLFTAVFIKENERNGPKSLTDGFMLIYYEMYGRSARHSGHKMTHITDHVVADVLAKQDEERAKANGDHDELVAIDSFKAAARTALIAKIRLNTPETVPFWDMFAQSNQSFLFEGKISPFEIRSLYEPFFQLVEILERQDEVGKFWQESPFGKLEIEED